MTDTLTDMATRPPSTVINGHVPGLSQTPARPTAQTQRTTTAAKNRARAARAARVRGAVAVLHSSRTVGNLFFAGVLTLALVGGTQAALTYLDMPWYVAGAFVVLVELGGVYFASHADERRQEGEKAIAAQIISALVASSAVALQWFGHQQLGQTLPAFGFALMSLLGYVGWLLRSAAKRRDVLRSTGDLAQVTPSYGLRQWLREPGITSLAKELARNDSSLDRVSSLEAARDQKGMEVWVKQTVRKATGSDAQTAAILTVNRTEAVARELREMVDRGPLLRWLAGRLDPKVVFEGQAPRPIPITMGPDQLAAASSRAKTRASGNVPAASGSRGRKPAAEMWTALQALQAAHPDIDPERTKWFADKLGVSDSYLRGLKRRAAAGEFGGVVHP